MQAWLFSVFDWVRRNPTAQAIMFAFGVLMSVKTYGEWRAFKARAKAEAKAREIRAADELHTINTVHEIEKEARDDADEAIEARDDAPSYPDADSVPESTARRIFRD